MDRLKTLLTSSAALTTLTIALGVANLVALIGWGPIDPTNITWIFGDTATYYTGWAQFRHDRHLHFPLGWTERVGYPVGASIAFLDALPLVAVLLRPLSAILPEPFQYLGLYSVLCFALQAYFGLSLCRRLFPSHPAFAVLGSLFFVLSPMLTNRASGHTTLLTHWPILAALDSYFRDPGDRPAAWLGRQWIVLAIVGGLTPYIAFMCLLVALAAVARLAVERRSGWARTALFAATTVAVLFASAATFGLLTTTRAATYWAPGYGLFSMNLNAPFNPMAYGSILLPGLPVIHPWQYEGYNYFGLGVIALLVIGVVRRPQSILWMTERRVLPLAALALVSAALAASTTVSFGSRTLVDISAASITRAVRHYWPVCVLIVAAALVLTFRIWKVSRRMAIVAATLVLVLGFIAAAIVAFQSLDALQSVVFAPLRVAAAIKSLRASGRLFWPAYYVILVAALSITFWSWKTTSRVAILAVLLVVQFADLTAMRTRVRATMDQRFPSPLQSAPWQSLGRTYENLILLPALQCEPFTGGAGGLHSYVWFGRLAAAQHMRINSYYAARYDRDQMQTHCVDLLRGQLEGKLDPKSAYVVTGGVRTVWALGGIGSHRCQEVDGQLLCMPIEPSNGSGEPLQVPPAAPYVLGDRLDFKKDDLDRYLTFGWGPQEPNGRWTIGPLAVMRLGLENTIDPARILTLDIEAYPFLKPYHPRVDVDLVINGETLDGWTFAEEAATTKRVRIPAASAAGRRALDIQLRIRNPELPGTEGLPPAFLGIKVVSMVVRYE
jgi:uncharacterized protein DUF6311